MAPRPGDHCSSSSAGPTAPTRPGFAIGGVPPLGHAEPLEVLIDEGLVEEEEIWAAAGTPNAVFGLAAADLQALTGGRVVRVAQ